MATTVVNIKTDPCDVYIGRRKGTGCHYGNPFGRKHEDGGQTRSSVKLKILDTFDREETIKAYDNWLEGTAHQEVEPARRKWILRNLPTLKGLVLGCWCKPRTCHGDVLARRADVT